MTSNVQISVSDPDLRAYITACINAMPDVHLSNREPDLIVTDSTQLSGDGVPRLHVVEDPVPGASDFVLMPFDARVLAHAVRRALQRRK